MMIFGVCAEKPLAIPLTSYFWNRCCRRLLLQVGSDVENIKVGDRVVSHGNMSCRVCKACTEWYENLIVKKEPFGVLRQDLFGEVIVNLHILPEVNVLKNSRRCII